MEGEENNRFCGRDLCGMLSGKFIVVDGIDGSGKTTLIAGLQRELCQQGIDVEVCRDPGGTRVGDAVRRVVLDVYDSPMTPRCEALLFMAARAQLVTEVILPAQERGACVLCDRFVSSTLAYQVVAGLSPKEVAELAEFAIGACWPDLTIILDVDVSQGFERTGRKVAPGPVPKHLKNDRTQACFFEDAWLDAVSERPVTYFRRVRDRFLKLHLTYPTPVRVLDGRANVQAILGETLATISDVFIRARRHPE